MSNTTQPRLYTGDLRVVLVMSFVYVMFPIWLWGAKHPTGGLFMAWEIIAGLPMIIYITRLDTLALVINMFFVFFLSVTAWFFLA